eukprot:TRINITY_DN994_c0_g1_i1.p1 TRINITY_DN994_c0_g1~~TRINITY_DN994_c0_g1_i1.p1  ORF type:complete len:443 (+),score=42.08 TRINITY_DN994_c0_g1_i1:148-1476(+)
MMDMITTDDIISVHSIEEKDEVKVTPTRKVMNPLAGRKRGAVVQAGPAVPVCCCEENDEDEISLVGIQMSIIGQALFIAGLAFGVYFTPMDWTTTLPVAGGLAVGSLVLCVIYVTHAVRGMLKQASRHECCLKTLEVTIQGKDDDGAFSTSDDESMRQMSEGSDVSSNDGPRCWALHVRHNKNKKVYPMESRKGSVVCTGIDTRKAMDLAGTSIESFGVQASWILQQVIDVVNKNHGMMHGMYGERFYYSFNTWRPTYSHQQAAAMTALQLAGISGHRGRGDETSLTLTSSVSCGPLTCGSIGNEGCGRHYMVTGVPTQQVNCLQTLAFTTLHARIVVDERIYRSCIGCFVFRVIDNIAFCTPSTAPENLHELLASKAANSKEWMYYEQTLYDTAVAHLLKKDFATALNIFNSIPISERDAATLRMKHFAEIERSPPYTTLA